MVEEKEYFKFKLFGLIFSLSDDYRYTDRETGKIHMNKKFKITKVDYKSDEPFIDYFGFYSGFHPIEFRYSTCGYDDNYHNVNFSLGYGSVWITLPWKNKKEECKYGEDVNNPEPKYGFCFTDGGSLVNGLHIFKGKEYKIYDLPFSLDFYKYSVYSNNELVNSNHCCGDELNPDTNHLKFRYVRKDGLVQDAIAYCYFTRREWNRRWIKWINWFNKVEYNLDIEFHNEDGSYCQIGNSQDSWKGGTIGCGCKVTKKEFESKDYETAFRRFERKANLRYEFD